MGKNDNTSIVSVFSDRDVNVKTITDGTHLFAIFADISYDAKDAACEEDTMIEVTSIFSDVELFLPDNIKLTIQGNSLFGDIKDRRRKTTTSEIDRSVTIRALSLFGDVNIR